MKITFFSHAYQVSENKKNIAAFSKLASVKVVLQDKWLDLGNNLHAANTGDSTYNILRSLKLFRGQYVLVSISLGLRQFKPDIILVEYNPWSSIFIQVLICKNIFYRNAKLVCLIKKNTFVAKGMISGRIKSLVARSMLKRIDYFLAASEMVSEQLLHDTFSIPKEKISVVTHLGVDTDWFSPRPPNEYTISVGYCGRLESYKGVTDLIDAVKLIKQEGKDFTNVRLMLLGVGSLRCKLNAEKIKTTWLEVYEAVPIEEVADFLNKIDIFVMPSRVLEDHQEHDAHALMEAMSCGKACIGSRSGIIPEILKNDCGVLVTPESPIELAKVLKELILNKTKREILGKLAREKAQKEFSLDVVACKKISIFSRLLNRE